MTAGDLVTRKLPAVTDRRYSNQFSKTHADQRGTQHDRSKQFVIRMKNQLQEGNQIGDFGLLVKRRSLHHVDRYAVGLQSAEVHLDVRHGPQQDGYLLPRLNPFRTLPLFEKPGYRFGLHLPSLRRFCTRFGRHIRNAQERCIGFRLQQVRRREANPVGGIDAFVPDIDFTQPIHHLFRQPICKLRDGQRRAIVVLKMLKDSPFVQDPLQHAKEDCDPCTPEPIDGLLRIADDHQLPRSKAAGPVRIFGEQRDDLGLDLIGVLELIDEQRLKVILVMLPNGTVVLEKVASAEQKIVEIHRIRGSLLRAKTFGGTRDEPRKVLGGTYTRDLADTRKKRLRIVALAKDMFGLFGFQLVRKLAHLLEVPAVFLNFSGELPAEC